ncbi:MAG TPA: hypothetical protein VIL95_07920 [Bacillota bacterium]
MSDTSWPWQTPVAVLLRQHAPGADPRRLQQFACACCRRVEHLLRDDRSRRALGVAERFAAGQADEQELRAAQQAAGFINEGKALEEYAMAVPHAVAAYAVYLATKVRSVEDAAYVAHECASAVLDESEAEELEEWSEEDPPPPTPEEEYQCQLVRAMFGSGSG